MYHWEYPYLFIIFPSQASLACLERKRKTSVRNFKYLIGTRRFLQNTILIISSRFVSSRLVGREEDRSYIMQKDRVIQAPFTKRTHSVRFELTPIDN